MQKDYVRRLGAQITGVGVTTLLLAAVTAPLTAGADELQSPEPSNSSTNTDNVSSGTQTDSGSTTNSSSTTSNSNSSTSNSNSTTNSNTTSNSNSSTTNSNSTPQPVSAVLTGTGTMDAPLGVTTVGWAQGTTFTYQWLRDGEEITGATGATFTPTVDDYRSAISVRVTGGGADTRTAVSNETDPVVSEDAASITIELRDAENGTRGYGTILLGANGGLIAEAQADPDGNAVFTDLPERSDYFFLVKNTGGDDVAAGQNVPTVVMTNTERVVLMTSVLQPDTYLDDSYIGRNQRVGVWTGDKTVIINGSSNSPVGPDLELTNVGLYFTGGSWTVNGGVTPFEGDFWGRIALDLPGHTGRLWVTRAYSTRESYTTFTTLSIVSGSTVYDQYGTPVSGANVTLEHADSATDPFMTVDNSDLADSSTSTTGSDYAGRFGFLLNSPSGVYRAIATKGDAQGVSAVVDGSFEREELSITLDSEQFIAPTVDMFNIEGDLSVDSELTSSFVFADDDIDITSYAWMRDGVAIPGADAADYVLTSDDAGHEISLVITSARPGFESFDQTFVVGTVAAPIIDPAPEGGSGTDPILVTPVSTGTVTPVATAPSSSKLASAGADTGMLPLAALLVLGGGALVATRRRRRQA